MSRTGRQPVLEVCAAVVVQRRRFLLARRPPGSHLAGKWEFPGGKTHPGETREACIVREIREELGVAVSAPRFLASLVHRYPEKRVRLHFLRCRWPRGAQAQSHDGQESGWFTLAQMAGLDLAPADARFAARLRRNPGLAGARVQARAAAAAAPPPGPRPLSGRRRPAAGPQSRSR